MRIGSNIVAVKNHNRQALLQCLLDRPCSRVELADALGVTSMTVTNLVRDLLAQGWVEELTPSAEMPRTAGRPRRQLQLRPDAGSAIGIHIGIGAFRVAVVDLIGTVQTAYDGTFDLEQDSAETVAQIAKATDQLLSDSAWPRNKLLGIGVGASGLVDSERGVNVIAPSLGWQAVPLAEVLQPRFELPVFVENNVRAMALAESYFGQARAVDSLAFVFGRIGVGAGFVMQRKLFRGIAAGAGEIGHTIIQPENGARCRCGQSGCLETLVTVPTLLATDPHQTYEQFLAAARNGSSLQLEKLTRLTHYLGIALINLVNTLNPEQIVLGGMYAEAADLLLPPLRTMVRERAFGRLGEHVQLKTTAFGANAGAIGAATLALANNFYDKPL